MVWMCICIFIKILNHCLLTVFHLCQTEPQQFNNRGAAGRLRSSVKVHEEIGSFIINEIDFEEITQSDEVWWLR